MREQEVKVIISTEILKKMDDQAAAGVYLEISYLILAQKLTGKELDSRHFKKICQS